MRHFYSIFIVCLFSGTRAQAAVEPELKQFLAAPFDLAIRGYQKWVSPAKGAACPMMPSDSEYARQAIQRYGLWNGGLLTADRLHRCSHDTHFYPVIPTSSGLKLLDPVPNLDKP